MSNYKSGTTQADIDRELGSEDPELEGEWRTQCAAPRYHFIWTMAGTSASDTWATDGAVEAEGLPEAIDLAMREVFMKLTKGEAKFGHPGEGGCHGPYKITSLAIYRKRHEENN